MTLDWYYRPGAGRRAAFTADAEAMGLAVCGDVAGPREDFDAIARSAVPKAMHADDYAYRDGNAPRPAIPQRELDALADVVIESTGPHRQMAALVAFARPWDGAYTMGEKR